MSDSADAGSASMRAASYRHRVRCQEVDAQGILYNSRYLEIADAALVEFFRALGWAYPDLMASGMDPSLVDAHIAFRRPAGLDEQIDVHVELTGMGTTSFSISYRLVRVDLSAPAEGAPADELEVAKLTVVYVNFDPVSRSKRPIPPEIAGRMRHAIVPPLSE